MSTEFTAALAAELSGVQLTELDVYPGRGGTAAATQSHACFLDVTSDSEAAFEVMARLVEEFPGLPVVVLLRANDSDLIVEFLRRGALDFLVQPFSHEQFSPVLRKLTRLRSGASVPARTGGRVLCIVPGKGACGATTIACNLAFAFKGLKSPRVLLADLDGLTGTVSFVLKLKSAYSFVDAVSQAHSLDADMWKALVTSVGGIDVLLSPEDAVDCYAEALDPVPLVNAARKAYDVVVLDSGGAHGDWNTHLARLADELLVVTTNELPALHATQRALDCLDHAGVSRKKAHVLLNRHRPRVGLNEEAVGTALGVDVYRTLPNDTPAIRKALMEGVAVPSATTFGRSISALARALTGMPARTPAPSLLTRLQSLFR